MDGKTLDFDEASFRIDSDEDLSITAGDICTAYDRKEWWRIERAPESVKTEGPISWECASAPAALPDAL